MRFNCLRTDLSNAVSNVSRAVSAKATLPALEGVLIKAYGSQLEICGYDLEIGIVTTVEASIAEEGEIVVSARLFNEIIRKLPEEFVNIETDDKMITYINSGAADYQIVGMNSSEYPELPNVEEISGLTINAEILKNMIRQTVFATSDNMAKPIYTGSLPTFITIAVLGILGLCVLNLIKVNKTPPLIPVIAMSLLYMGVLLSIIFAIHVLDFDRMGLFELYLLLPPLVFVLMSMRATLGTVREYAPAPSRMSRIEGSYALSSFLKMLEDSKRWPVIALIMTIPLLGILICILMIFGQAPDAVIKAFTETADFRLSQKIPPQQLYYDEHYLCTVAAGGDHKIVKPLRMGIRQGHPVVVNRQLCIANAFEQVLEERTPQFHKAVRSFYDTCGLPVARLIRTKTAADIVYFIMKPLEWLFLIILYVSDVNPEDRIAMQYTGTSHRALL